jgi:hypothetical protein
MRVKYVANFATDTTGKAAKKPRVSGEVFEVKNAVLLYKLLYRF